MAQVVAALVLPIVIELYAEAAVRTAVQALQKAFDRHTRAQLEIIDAGEDARIEKIRCV